MDISKLIYRNIEKERATIRDRLFNYHDRQRGFFELTRIYRFMAQPVSIKDSIGIVFYVLVFVIIGYSFFYQINKLDMDIAIAVENAVNSKF